MLLIWNKPTINVPDLSVRRKKLKEDWRFGPDHVIQVKISGIQY